RGLARRLSGYGAAALTPGDTCPDNDVQVADGLVLIDFEDAQWRHVVWDVAYLTVPFPSCWCSWRLPAEVTARAVAAYRSVAGAAFPEVAGPGFERDLEAATFGLALGTTGGGLGVAVGTGPRGRGGGPR